MTKMILLLACLMFSGCVNNSSLLVGPRGKVIRCASTGWGFIGIPAANSNFDRCIEDAESLGYIPMEEAGMIGLVINQEAHNGECVVGRVQPGSPADMAKVQPEDVVLAVNGQKPAGPDDLSSLLFGKKNVPIELLIRHQGESRTISLVRAPRQAR